MIPHGRWRIGALASAIALLGSLASLEAHAVALGRVTVQSALGESLRAEIDLSDLNPEETASLRIGVAGADTFKAAGLEYTAAVAGLDVRLQKRPDGRPYLRLSSNRAITEPFVDLILEARWASGRVTRDYTMLFDPPSPRANNAITAPSARTLETPQTSGSNSATFPREAAPTPAARPAPRAATAAKPAAVSLPPPQTMPAGTRQVTVKPGDNISKIAAQNKPASVSLDQMLMALLRNNSEAFVGGNINLLKSGAVLDIPDEQTAGVLPANEARQTLIAVQSSNFNTFRSKLADSVPAAPLDSAGSQLGGKVQAKVEDRAQPVTPPDKLTLSKGAIQARSADESLPKDATNRATEAPKAATDPAKPGALPATGIESAPGGAAALSGATGAAVGVPAIASAPAPGAETAAEPAPAPLAASSAPVVPAEAPAAVAKKPVVVVPPAPAPEPTLVDQILDNSLLLGGGALVALLAGLGFARFRKNKKSGSVDSSFLDSRLQPDSFFGASGGRRIDTSASKAGGSSMAYSPSQLDAAGDVDPIAEADVYLAYGRDQQAEEILREALRTHPTRLAIHTKLLEIFAKRRDNKAFESMALTAFNLTNGQGAEWSYVSQMGRELEPGNSLYQPQGATPSGAASPETRAAASPMRPVENADRQEFAAPAARPAVPEQNLDIDFDLDLDLGMDSHLDAPASIVPGTTPAPTTSPPSMFADSGIAPASSLVDELDFDLDSLPEVPASPSAAARPAMQKPADGEIDFLADGLDFTPEPYVPPKASAPAPAPAPVTHSGMLEFDLNSLSLDLDEPPASAAQAAGESTEEDPLEIKFLLAEEFRVLGDAEGARSLADEVLAKARGPLKAKAQAFLNSL